MANTILGNVTSLPFPGRIIKAGDPDSKIVTALQQRLNEAGCGPIDEDGDFGSNTKKALKLFQARFPDANGNPLHIDGEAGSITWSVLFGPSSVPAHVSSPSGSLSKAVIAFAETQIGIRESPLGSNRGKEVDEYLRAVGIDPKSGSFPWCVAFTHFCYLKGAESLHKDNPHIKTAGVLDHWNKAKSKAGVVRITNEQAVADPGLVLPGSLFIIDFGGGFGHSGIVAEAANGFLVTIEGNTNDGGSRNGIGVFKRQGRKIKQINKGFIDYSSF